MEGDDSRHESPSGRCEDMCPKDEIVERLKWDDFHHLEKGPLPSTSIHWEDARLEGVDLLACKKFKRNIEAIDRSPERLRTLRCLVRTTAHLVSLLDMAGVDFEDAHKLLWDRFRAIRTDLQIQRLMGAGAAVAIYEQHVRYHICCSYELCERKANLSNPHGFDPHLNSQQLHKSLQTLLQMYDNCASKRDNEAEFVGYDLLIGADAFKLMHMRRKRVLLRSRPVVFALKVRSAADQGNYAKFLSLFREASYLEACLMHMTGLRRSVLSRATEVMRSKVFGSRSPNPFEDARLALGQAAASLLVCEDWEAVARKIEGETLCEAISSKKEATFSAVVNGRP